MEVRPATVQDVPRIAAALARAYEDDPLTRWYVAEDSRRVERLRRVYEPSVRRMVSRRMRETYTTSDVAGAAMWAAPGRCHLPRIAMLPAVPAMLAAIGIGGMRRMGRVPR